MCWLLFSVGLFSATLSLPALVYFHIHVLASKHWKSAGRHKKGKQFLTGGESRITAGGFVNSQ